MDNATDTLSLEYNCTDEEMSEARSLGLRHEFRNRKKSLVFFGVFIALVATAIIYRIQHEIPVQRRPLAYALTIAVVAGISFLNRMTGKKTAKPLNTIEIAPTGLRIRTVDTHIAIPWTGVSECLESKNVFGIFLRTEGIQFVLPKRVFPDEAAVDWFRQRARQSCKGIIDNTAPAVSLPHGEDRVEIKFRLGLWDYANRTFVSTLVWLIVILVLFFAIISELREAPNLSPDGIGMAFRSFVSHSRFLVPVLIALFGVMTILPWLMHRRLAEQHLAFSDEGITIFGPDGSAKVPWTTYPRFKETKRYFLLWGMDRTWLMLPKKAFDSATAGERCRALFKRYLTRTWWYIG